MTYSFGSLVPSALTFVIGFWFGRVSKRVARIEKEVQKLEGDTGEKGASA